MKFGSNRYRVKVDNLIILFFFQTQRKRTCDLIEK